MTNKYRAKSVCIDGYRFDSMGEGRRYRDLLLLERAGEIENIQVHPKWTIEVNGEKIQTYTADFSYYDKKRGKVVVEDFKSEPTAKKLDFRRTCKLMKAVHDIEVEVVYG